MKKRTFLKNIATTTVALGIMPELILSSCSNEKDRSLSFSFELPDLPYKYDALEPAISEANLKLHHLGRHQQCIDVLNIEIENYTEFKGKPITEILKLDNVPDEIHNYGGAHYNHSLFWESLTPGEQKIPQPFMDMVEKWYTNLDFVKSIMIDYGMMIFGSGWVWLIVDEYGYLKVITTPNNATPLRKIAGESGTPLLGIDVWEHSYYYDYQSDRKAYLEAILDKVNWQIVGERLPMKEAQDS